MDLPPFKSRPLSNLLSSPPTLPDELMAEVLSFLSVRSLMQMKCVSKFFNSLISDPFFINLHLRRSAQNPNLTLVSGKNVADFRFVIQPVNQLLDNPLITMLEKPFYPLLDTYQCWLVGSCNGLLCFANYSTLDRSYRDCWLNFYNPATNVLSKKLGYFKDHYMQRYFFSRYAVGYDNSTDTFKVAALRLIGGGETELRTKVRVFSLGDNVWRDIQCFPVGALRLTLPSENHGVYLNGNLNWLALRNCYGADRFYHCSDITVDQFVIISLDLGTERHKQLMPPRGLDEVPHVEPIICVLMDSLCFCHDFKQTCLVIWHMREFGVEESWTQLHRISYQNLQHVGAWLPLHISQSKNTMVLANKRVMQAIIYNWTDNKIEIITNKPLWIFSKDYVESLISV